MNLVIIGFGNGETHRAITYANDDIFLFGYLKANFINVSFKNSKHAFQ